MSKKGDVEKRAQANEKHIVSQRTYADNFVSTKAQPTHMAPMCVWFPLPWSPLCHAHPRHYPSRPSRLPPPPPSTSRPTASA